MAGKKDFTEEEWEQLRKGATGAGLLVAASDRGFLDTFKEASSLAKFLKGSRDDDSQLVRELSSGGGTGFGLVASPNEVENGTVEALRGGVETLRAKAPDELESYRAFVIDLAESVGRSAGGGDEAEAAAVEKLKAALANASTDEKTRPPAAGHEPSDRRSDEGGPSNAEKALENQERALESGEEAPG